MRMIRLIENRVLARLNTIAEAGKKKPKGVWSDIDNGAGGSIYNRSMPSRARDAKANRVTMSRQYEEAAEKWRSMPSSERSTFMASEMGGFSREDRNDMVTLTWAELVSELGGPEEQVVNELVKNLLHWA